MASSGFQWFDGTKEKVEIKSKKMELHNKLLPDQPIGIELKVMYLKTKRVNKQAVQKSQKC